MDIKSELRRGKGRGKVYFQKQDFLCQLRREEKIRRMGNTFRIDVEIVSRILRCCVGPFFAQLSSHFMVKLHSVSFIFHVWFLRVYSVPSPAKTISHFTLPINVNLNAPTL